MRVPSIDFQIREDGEWVTRSTEDFFSGKNCVIFSLPGAFTPTCTTKQLPAYDALYPKFAELGYQYV